MICKKLNIKMIFFPFQLKIRSPYPLSKILLVEFSPIPSPIHFPSPILSISIPYLINYYTPFHHIFRFPTQPDQICSLHLDLCSFWCDIAKLNYSIVDSTAILFCFLVCLCKWLVFSFRFDTIFKFSQLFSFQPTWESYSVVQ